MIVLQKNIVAQRRSLTGSGSSSSAAAASSLGGMQLPDFSQIVVPGMIYCS